MRVLLVGNYQPDRQFSMLTFGDCLKRNLPDHQVEVVRVAPAPRLRYLGVHSRSRKWLAYLDKYVVFPIELRRASRHFDLIHILDHGNAMYIPHIAMRPHLVTCHDMLAIRAARGEIPNWPVSTSGRKYQSLIHKGLIRSRHIAAVSQATLRDVLRLTELSEEHVSLVYNGLFQTLVELPLPRARSTVEALGIKPPFLLHVGNDVPYKNRSGVLRIFAELEAVTGPNCPRLVVAGKACTDHSSVRDPRIQFVDSPDLQTLTALYQMASGLLFPSLYEGFGLPILEAQLLGCPVFTSDRPPMTEVGGDAAFYFDPASPFEAAKVIARGLADSESMIERGQRNTERFSTNVMIENYVALYGRIVDDWRAPRSRTASSDALIPTAYRGGGRVRH